MILVFVYMVVVFADGLVTGSGLGTGLRVVRLWGVWRFLRVFSCLDYAFCCFGLWFAADLWFGLVDWLISRWTCAGLVAVLCRFFWYGC